MKMLFVVILPIFAFAEENKTNLRRVSAAAVPESRRTDNAVTFDSSNIVPTQADIPVTYQSEHLSHADISAASHYYDFSSQEHAKYGPRDARGLPRRAHPHKCAVGHIGDYRPREAASTCSETSKPENPQADENLNVNDPRETMFPEPLEGLISVEIFCAGTVSGQQNIELWYKGVAYDSIHQEVLQHHDAARTKSSRNVDFGYEQMGGFTQSELTKLQKAGSSQCRKTPGDACNKFRLAACSVNKGGDDHDELVHRVNKFLECNIDQWIQSCDEDNGGNQPSAKYEFWKKETVEDLHLFAQMPNGVNMVPGDGTVNPEAQDCMNFALERMCANGDCDASKLQSSNAVILKHYERGSGVPHTRDESSKTAEHEWLVSEKCVDPHAVWVTLQWNSDDSKLPPKNSLMVFGCPSEQFHHCGAACESELPFKSWQGWLTSEAIHKTDYNSERHCALWHQQKDLKELFARSADTIVIDADHAGRKMGYSEPQVCHKVNPDVADAWHKCENLSPDDCYFQKDTRFDPKYGQFYPHVDFKIWDHYYAPWWNDRLDWRNMLPVCFGCKHGHCDGADQDEGVGICELDQDFTDLIGSLFHTPLWMAKHNKRSTLERAGTYAGEAVVRDQGSCGSCWAFAAATVASHKTCIADCKQNGNCLYDNIILGNHFLEPWQVSTQAILSCNPNMRGCDGGWMSYGFESLKDFGVMKEKNFPCEQTYAKNSGALNTAGLLNSCKHSYEYACAGGHCQSALDEHGNTGCTGGNPTGHWTDVCRNQWGAACPYSWDFWQNPATPNWKPFTAVYNARPVEVTGHYTISTSESDYKHHLYNHGPFSIAFRVYGDFFGLNGCSGSDPNHVYHHVSGGYCGGHALVIVGYGWHRNTCGPLANVWSKYWTVQNSWGTGWGNGGYANIRRGTDECLIESWAAQGVDVNVDCQANHGDWAGQIRRPVNRQKYLTPQEKFMHAMESMKPVPAKSDSCPLPEFNAQKQHSMKGFELAHTLDDVTRQF